MPTSQPRKSRKRAREIREQSRAAGTRYTEAMRVNDRTQAGGQQSPPPRPILTRTPLVLPLARDAFASLYQLDTLLMRLGNVLVLDRDGVPGVRENAEGVPIPGAPIEDVVEAYWQVRGALPHGIEDLLDGTDEYPPNMLLLFGPDGGAVVHLAAIEVAEADLTLLAAFADALDRAAGPRPGPEFEALAEALGELGREPWFPWMPEGDGAAVADWARQALSPFLHSPYEGPRGAEDQETLAGVLRYAEDLGWEAIHVNEDEEDAAVRVMLSMMRAAGAA